MRLFELVYNDNNDMDIDIMSMILSAKSKDMKSFDTEQFRKTLSSMGYYVTPEKAADILKNNPQVDDSNTQVTVLDKEDETEMNKDDSKEKVSKMAAKAANKAIKQNDM